VTPAVTPAALARLHAAVFVRPRPWSAAEFAALLAAPSTILASAPEGFALGRVAAGEAELLTLAVAARARRQGLGRRLLAACEAAAASRGARRLVLEVAADNLAARALYAAAGYGEAGRRQGYYAALAGLAAADAIVLAKSLEAPGAAPAADPESC